MSENTIPLLSVLIPTKNRQHTCLFAIESVLLLNKQDVEVIVQDCSDTDILRRQIDEKFRDDKRIRYEYVDTKPSMTDNWNRAFERSTGQYKCGIGDDDAVLPNIYDLAIWANNNNIEALGHSKKYSYFWPDYTFIPENTSKLIITDSGKKEEVKIFDRNELDEILKTQAAIPNMDYRRLPIAYHTLLSESLILEIIKKTGRFLDGTSLDVYSAFSLGLLVKKYYFLDTPFTLPGSCGASNTSRIGLKKTSNHFAEFKSIDYDKRIPAIYNLTFTIAQSTQKALGNLKDVTYSKLLDLPYMYAEFLFGSFTIKTARNLYRLMKENKFTSKQYGEFLKLFFGKVAHAFKVNIKTAVKKLLSNFKFMRIKFEQRDFKNLDFYVAENILEAVDILKTKVSRVK